LAQGGVVVQIGFGNNFNMASLDEDKFKEWYAQIKSNPLLYPDFVETEVTASLETQLANVKPIIS
jgi:hypothetical protein